MADVDSLQPNPDLGQGLGPDGNHKASVTPEALALAHALASHLVCRPWPPAADLASSLWASQDSARLPPPRTPITQALTRLRRAASAAQALPASQLRAYHQRLLYDFALQARPPSGHALRTLCRLAATPAGWNGRCLAADPRQLARLLDAVAAEKHPARLARCHQALAVAAALSELAALPQAAATIRAALATAAGVHDQR